MLDGEQFEVARFSCHGGSFETDDFPINPTFASAEAGELISKVGGYFTALGEHSGGR